MKQKYSILKDDKEKKLIIKEFGELEKEEFSLICEVAFEYKKIKTAIKEGKQAFITAIRTPDLYPPAIYMDKIADEIISFFISKESASIEIVIDDKDLLSKKLKDIKEEPGIPEEEPADIDVSTNEIDSLLDIEDVDETIHIGKKASPDIAE